MAKPVHSMIRVLDEAKSLHFYARAFGLSVAERLGFPDFALIYLRHPSSPFEVELTVNFDRKEPYSLGDGYGHLAVVVDESMPNTCGSSGKNCLRGRCATSSTRTRRLHASSSSPIPMATRSR